MKESNESQGELFGGYTVVQARAKMFDDEEAFREGQDCPCCDQLVRLYPRKLNSNMTRFLCSLVRVYVGLGDGKGVHHRRLQYTGRDYSYVALWGLAETRKASEEDAGRMSGLWWPTPLGIQFARGELRVQSHALTFNQKGFGLEGDPVGVKECLGDHFNYKELMGWTEEVAAQ